MELTRIKIKNIERIYFINQVIHDDRNKTLNLNF